MTIKLLDAVDADGNSEVFHVANESRGDYRTVKITISGTVTVKFQGRMSSEDATWSDILSVTASTMQAIVLPPEVRFNVSGVSGSVTVSAWVDAKGV